MSLEHVKNATDAVVVSGVFAAFLGYLPDVAALAGLLYTVMRMITEWPRFWLAIKGWFK